MSSLYLTNDSSNPEVDLVILRSFLRFKVKFLNIDGKIVQLPIKLELIDFSYPGSTYHGNLINCVKINTDPPYQDILECLCQQSKE